MSKIICIANQKGGVGKTTTAVSLVTCLARAGKKTLLVDSDPQSNATSGFGIEKKDIRNSIYDALIRRLVPSELVISTPYENLFLIPSQNALTGAEIELIDIENRESRLKDALDQLRDDYDFIIIDAPPSLGLLTVNDLVACDTVIIPIQCEYYALEGLTQLLDTIDRVRTNFNEKLAIEGILMTMADIRTILSRQVIEEVKSYFPDKVYKTFIPRNVRLGEAPSFGKPIIYYDFRSVGAEKYLSFTEEFLLRQDNKSGVSSIENSSLNDSSITEPPISHSGTENSVEEKEE